MTIHTATPPLGHTSAPLPTPTEAPDERLRLARGAGLVSLLFSGAIFGFFYAWVCSTMWGLDEADPRVAIEAMQAMNASVRNPVFFPAFFGTPFVLAGTAALSGASGGRRAARRFALAAAIHLIGALLVTATVNVPMNNELAGLAVPSSIDDARVIWDGYSGRWQLFNQLRTVMSGVSLLLTGAGLLRLGDRR